MRKNSTARKDAASTLVLTGTARLSVSRGRLHVEDGYACLDTRRTLAFDLPLQLKRIIRIGNDGGSFTEEALRVLAEHGASLYAVTQKGELSYQVLPPDGLIRPVLLRAQARLAGTELGFALARRLIVQKVQGQQEVLAWLAKQATLPGLEDCLQDRRNFAEDIQRARNAVELQSAEGGASRSYFIAWSLPVSFYKEARGCVSAPPHWRKWDARLSLKSGYNRDATDPINALLNFSYAVAAAEILIACRAGSLDPGLGVLHADRDGRPSFVYDLLEPLRPLVDKAVLELITGRTFRMNKDFILLRDGVCRVGVEFAAEVGKLISERVRAKAEKVVTEVRSLILAAGAPSAAQRPKPEQLQAETLAEPEIDLAQHRPAPKGKMCARCGVWAGPRRKYCDTCLTEVRRGIMKERIEGWWEEWHEKGQSPGHTEEAIEKLRQSMSRSAKLKPRRGYNRKRGDDGEE